jgi:hypothetical protein
VISLINSYFVPVYVSNEDYNKDGSAPADEKAEKLRIYREALNAKLSAGTVHVYILNPDGHCIDSQHVATASKVDQLTRMLERNIDSLKTPAGQPLVKPVPQSLPCAGDPESIRLHLVARNLQRQGDDYVVPQVTLGTTKSGNWGAYPGENWVELNKGAWSRFLPAGDVQLGRTWDIDKETAAKLFNYFYPSTENNDIKKNRIDEQSLRASVLSVQDGTVTARLDGRLKMKHPFYHKDHGNVVEATVVGVLVFQPRTQRIQSLDLVTTHATYAQRPFGVAVRVVP